MYSYSGIGSIKRTLNNGKFTESESLLQNVGFM